MIGRSEPKDWAVMRLGAPWRLVIGLACMAGGIVALIYDFGTAKTGALVLMGLIVAASSLKGSS